MEEGGVGWRVAPGGGSARRRGRSRYCFALGRRRVVVDQDIAPCRRGGAGDAEGEGPGASHLGWELARDFGKFQNKQILEHVGQIFYVTLKIVVEYAHA